jgi:hypothetical protein
MLISAPRRTDDADLLSSRAVGPADGAPNDWRRALRLRPAADSEGEDRKDVFMTSETG